MVGQVYACFQNPGIIMVFVVASGFGMLFYRGADIPIHSRLVLTPPRLRLLSPMYK